MVFLLFMAFIALKKSTASYKDKENSRPNNVKATRIMYPKQK